MRRIVFALFCGCLLLGSAAAAHAEANGPQWTVTSVSQPTNFTPGDQSGEDSFRVTVTNTGGASSKGPVTITDELPAGLSLDPAGGSGFTTLEETGPGVFGENQSGNSSGFSCALRTCTYNGKVVPDQSLMLKFPVDVAADPSPSCEVPAGAVSCVTNLVRVVGGGADDASVQTPTAISGAKAGFGIAPGGASTAFSTLQAGAHPDITNTLAFDTTNANGSLANDFKDVSYRLPPGFASDFADAPVCSPAVFIAQECPTATQIGVTTLTLVGLVPATAVYPVYNIAPSPGELARLGFTVVGYFDVIGAITLRPGDYGATVSFQNTNQASGDEVDSVSLTVWGVPAAPVHDTLRFKSGVPPTDTGALNQHSSAAPTPFFTNPTSCGSQQLASEFEANSWQEPEQWSLARMPFGPFTGCDRLAMAPALTAEVTSKAAEAPTGFDLATEIPQTYENPEGLATPTLKRETVTLPEGMTVNPSSGAGLGACSEAQYAEEGVQFVPGHGCPSNSKLATVRIKTPALKEEATGTVYLAEPAPRGESGRNPFDKLLSVYLVARIPARGVLIHSPGVVEPDLVSGRLTTTFDELPPLPFTVATFEFNQGANAPLVTPATCGAYSVTAALTPYAEPDASPLQPLVPPFFISSGVDGGACPAGGTPPFRPRAVAGTEHNAAGSYSPLYLRIDRSDGEQEITGFSMQLPPGLSGKLSGIPFCGEGEVQRAREQTGAQAEAEPACPAGSAIGHTIAEAGVGTVLVQTPGKLYLGAPFEGAPFSVVSITSAHVGPFDLGTVVVHLPLRIDPLTAQVSVPAGPSDQVPHIIDGIVIHLRTIRAYIDRPSFLINPTNCNPQSIGATVIGSGTDLSAPVGQNPVSVNDPFQAADCQNLAFKPSFKAYVTGKNSRADGAALKVKIAYPSAPQGTQANIHYVRVELPRHLPSRLTTLQKACLSTVFEANPASCPAASAVGHATAITPILPVPLTGPAYFVSYGNAKFPELVIVLQGYGVTIYVHGETFISKQGITSSTFHQVPDQPVTSFELTLPQGPYSALTTNAELCKLTRTKLVSKRVKVKVKGRVRTVARKVRKTTRASLTMPTELIGQNGMVLRQSTPIALTGCPKAKPAHRRRRGHRTKS
jgi:uncharacterized repeat protein (TIGR01451 family)